MKWCLVIAGLQDLSRPVETLSTTQQTALAVCFILSRQQELFGPDIPW
jgi:hypothetical protein